MTTGVVSQEGDVGGGLPLAAVSSSISTALSTAESFATAGDTGTGQTSAQVSTAVSIGVSTAESYATSADTSLSTGVSTSASVALSTAESYATSSDTSISTATSSSISTALSTAESYALSSVTSLSTGVSTSASVTLSTAESYALSEVVSLSTAVSATHPGFPGYTAGNWYLPEIETTTAGAAIASTTTMVLFPVVFQQQMTIDQLAARVTTVSAGGNFQLAIYASGTGNKPTGNALATSGNGSTASAAAVTVTLSSNVQVTPGVVYWIGVMVDNTTAIFISYSGSSSYMAWVYGSTSAGNALGTGAVNIANLTATYTTFGTWPSLTGATFTETTTTKNAAAAFHVTSIP